MAANLGKYLVLFLAIGIVQISAQEEDLEKYVIRMPALGRTARLGSLYNTATSTFSEISVLNKPLEDLLVSSTATPSTNTKLGIMKSYSDKSALLDVDAELTLNVLSGLVKVTGSARYIHDEQKKSNSVVGALTYEILTYEDILEVFYDDMLKMISPAVLNQTDESHLVIGIGWGATVVCKFEDSNEDNRDITEVQAKMGVNIQTLNFGISSDAAVEVDEGVLEGFASYSLQVFGDIAFDSDDYPTNVTQVIRLIQKVPRLVYASNEGKGKQLFFYLLPMDRVRQFMSYDRNQTQVQPQIPPEDVQGQIQLFEETQIVRLKLNDLSTKMMSNRDILNNSDLHTMHNLVNEFNNSTLTYKSQLKTALVEVRSGRQADINYLKNMNRQFREEDSALEQTENAIDNDFRDSRLKVELVEFLRAKGSIWVGRSDAVDTSIIKLFKTKGTDISICSIHFYREYLRNTILFVNAVMKAVNEMNFIPLIVDCDFLHGTCDSPINKNMTCSYLYGPTGTLAEPSPILGVIPSPYW